MWRALSGRGAASAADAAAVTEDFVELSDSDALGRSGVEAREPAQTAPPPPSLASVLTLPHSHVALLSVLSTS